MTIALKNDDAVADLLEHVADLVRKGLVTGLSIHMKQGQDTRASIEFKSPPTDDVVAPLKALENG